MASKAAEAGRKRRLAQERKERRADPAYRRRVLITWLVVGAAVVGAGVFVAKTVDFSAKCPGHWHATFGIYIPGPDGTPQRVDFASPRSEKNPALAYYQLGQDPKMRLSIHMHQSGSEQGAAELGPTQLHYETNGACESLQDAMETLDVGLDATSLTLGGAHAQAHQTGVWENAGNQTLQFWLQTTDGIWHDKLAAEMLGYQLKDGESTLIAFGNYSPQQVATMQNSIPAPMSRGGA